MRESLATAYAGEPSASLLMGKFNLTSEQFDAASAEGYLVESTIGKGRQTTETNNPKP